MDDHSMLDGRFFILIFAMALGFFAFIVKTINIWLENDMLRRKFDYHDELENKLQMKIIEKTKVSLQDLHNLKKYFSNILSKHLKLYLS